jgi:hypothetical protein
MGGSRTWRIRSLTVEHGLDGLWDASDASKVIARRSSPFMAVYDLLRWRWDAKRAGIK